MVYNNQFSNDTTTGRLFRLERVSANLAGYAVELGVPADITTWGAGCHAAFQAKRTAFEVETNEAQEATTALLQVLGTLESEYQVARQFAYELYADSPERLDGFGFDEPFPDKQDRKIQRVVNIITRHAKLVAEGASPLFPTALLTRLQTAANNAQAALTERHDEAEDAIHASTEYKIIWANDTKMLKKLLSWCVLSWGDNDVKLNDVGYARREQMGEGGGGQPPAIPVATYAEPNMNWAAVANATSYDAVTSTDEGVTTNEIVSAENVLTVAVPRGAEDIWARIRSRNANGVSDWSAWLIIPALILAAIQNFIYTASVGFSWTPTAENIRIEASFDGGATWNEIASGAYPSGTYGWVPPPGMFRIRRESGGLVGPWVVITVS